MYDGRKIANFILSEFDPKQFELSNLKLNKVLYLVHGFYLARASCALIKNHFEAWKHGPVISVIFHEFKKFQDGPITKPAEYLNYATGVKEVVSFADVPNDAREFIRGVAGHYVQYSAWQLREMTHEPGGPWHLVTSGHEPQRIRDRIPNELIRAYFAKQFGGVSMN